jgi:ferredoxin
MGRCSDMARYPVLDPGECSGCDGCLTVCPSVFQRNEAAGYIEVAECEEYPETEIQEAMNICPRGCIYWEEE